MEGERKEGQVFKVSTPPGFDYGRDEFGKKLGRFGGRKGDFIRGGQD